MQITEKYKKDYEISLQKIKEVRKEFVNALNEISALRIIPSQANYVMIEIKNNMTAKELTKRLLLQYNIFIKDLSQKIIYNNKQYIRVAVRNREDNDKLIAALEEIFV